MRKICHILRKNVLLLLCGFVPCETPNLSNGQILCDNKYNGKAFLGQLASQFQIQRQVTGDYDGLKIQSKINVIVSIV